MIIVKMQDIQKDIQTFKSRGYKEKLDKAYRKFPKTKCDSCGVCCTDSPTITYPELLYIFNYMDEQNFDDNLRKQLYTNSLRDYMYSLIRFVHCPFLNSDKMCLIHQVSPLACKRWGLQSKEENQSNWENDNKSNISFKNHFAKLGIIIPDEIINRRTPYCSKVEVIKNPYNYTSRDFETFTSSMNRMIDFYEGKTQISWNLCTYIAFMLLGNSAYEIRNKLTIQYQNGNKNIIEDYIQNINISDLL